MTSSFLLHQLVQRAASVAPASTALRYGAAALDYAGLAAAVEAFAGALLRLGTGRAERVGIYLEKRFETVIASFGAPQAGAVFVPINPLLKAAQAGYILRDCNVRVLVTSAERLTLLAETLSQCPDLRHVIVIGAESPALSGAIASHRWSDVMAGGALPGHRVIDTDMLAILYTSGSTGKPKGVVLSHRNMVAGAKSVASYLDNQAQDVILSVLPLSFDAGFSQLTTAFHRGAQVVLLNYLLPKDAVRALEQHQVTGLTAVPPIWIQLAQLQWPESIASHLRYIANTGGHMPRETLNALRAKLPRTKPYLMYGLTEAFRSTYLPPAEVDKRPDSIGKAIPNAEILVLREDGMPCAPNEPGELVHRGALVGMGYWNDPEKTAERYKPLPHRESGLVLPEVAVFSGDTVRMDEEGFIYFIGRRDEMMKTSGYRVSPTEIEEVLYGTQMVGEAAAFGIAHPRLGQAIVVVATGRDGQALDVQGLLSECRARLPAYMVPAHIDARPAPLPRNPNGKIDRKTLSLEFQHLYRDAD
jgi:acyl-CoA ligase (AMP-forming) (exosortase A-associated)